MIVDGSNQILGRLASEVAKRLLDGEKIEVINAEDVVISGNPENIYDKYMKRREARDPHHGPFYPIRPERIFRRTVRGMLPVKKSKGRKAFKRLTVVSRNPDKKEGEFITKSVADISTNYITLKELSSKLKNR